MSPRTEEQFKEIRTNKVELIMNSALELFAQQSYNTTSISQIAKKAGISKGLMYNYFTSKEDLLKRIIIGGMQRFLDLLKVKDIENIQKRELIRFIETNLNLIKSDADYYKLYFSLTFKPSTYNLLEKEMKGMFEEIFSIFIKYFTQKGEKNPFAKTRFLLATFDGVGIHYLSDIETFPIDDVKEMIIEIL